MRRTTWPWARQASNWHQRFADQTGNAPNTIRAEPHPAARRQTPCHLRTPLPVRSHRPSQEAHRAVAGMLAPSADTHMQRLRTARTKAYPAKAGQSIDAACGISTWLIDVQGRTLVPRSSAQTWSRCGRTAPRIPSRTYARWPEQTKTHCLELARPRRLPDASQRNDGQSEGAGNAGSPRSECHCT